MKADIDSLTAGQSYLCKLRKGHLIRGAASTLSAIIHGMLLLVLGLQHCRDVYEQNSQSDRKVGRLRGGREMDGGDLLAPGFLDPPPSRFNALVTFSPSSISLAALPFNAAMADSESGAESERQRERGNDRCVNVKC